MTWWQVLRESQSVFMFYLLYLYCLHALLFLCSSRKLEIEHLDFIKSYHPTILSKFRVFWKKLSWFYNCFGWERVDSEIILPVQCVPRKEAGHWHVYDSAFSKHTPEFKQGLGKQWSCSKEEFRCQKKSYYKVTYFNM